MRKEGKKVPSILDGHFFARIKKETSRKKGKLRFVLFLAGLVLLVYIYSSGDFGFIRIFSLRQEKKNLNMEIKAVEAKIIDLKLEKMKLTSDLHYIERIARLRYGMIKKGEKIYKFVPSQPEDMLK